MRGADSLLRWTSANAQIGYEIDNQAIVPTTPSRPLKLNASGIPVLVRQGKRGQDGMCSTAVGAQGIVGVDGAKGSVDGKAEGTPRARNEVAT